MQETLEDPVVGNALKAYLKTQETLITSIPREAAAKIHALALENLISGQRAGSIVDALMEIANITKTRADLIARTETARASSGLTQIRANAVGSEGYIWRTSRDSLVRDSHAALEGKYIKWDSPPKTDNGISPYHAGQGPNCRCYPEPVIPGITQDSASKRRFRCK